MMDILEKLERMAALPQGAEMPEWLSADPFMSWDVPLRKLFYDAAEDIRKSRKEISDLKSAIEVLEKLADEAIEFAAKATDYESDELTKH